VKADLRTLVAFSLAMAVSGAGAEPVSERVAARSGQYAGLDFFYSLNPDCTSKGEAHVALTGPPKNGGLFVSTMEHHPKFPRDSEFYKCNAKLVPSMQLYYKSNQDYVGDDALSVELTFPDDSKVKVHFDVTVK
jgi:hypothetical protein